MMRHNKNELGGALVMVLLLVLVFTILGMGLLTMNISAAKQFNKKEKQVQARHLAEMGVLHYQAIVKKEVENSVANNDFDINNLQNRISGFSNLKGDNYNVRGINSVYNVINKELSLEITSEGNSGSTMKEINATIIVEVPLENKIGDGGNNAPPKPPSGDVQVKNGDFTIMNGPTEQYGGSLHVKGNLKVEPGNGANVIIHKDLFVEKKIDIPNHACMVVKGDFTVLSNIETLKAHTYIVVYGDAYINNDPEINNKAGFYVHGKVTVGSKVKSSAYKDSISIPETCLNLGDLPQPGKPKWKVKVGVNPKY